MIRLETEFCGRTVPIWRERWQRVLSFAGGRVSTMCPVLLIYGRAAKRAEREAKRLERYGYRVTVRKAE